MDGFQTVDTAEDEENSRGGQALHHEPHIEEIRQEPLQTPDEEGLTISSEISPTPDQADEIEESNSGQEEMVSFFEDSPTVVTRRSVDVAAQGRIDDEVHENLQRSDMMHKESDRQSSRSQPVECLQHSIFCEEEMGSSRREGDKTEITQQQVRIFDGAHEKRHQSVHMMLAESESASELSHILGNGVACVPTASLQDNISIEETMSSSESMLLVTGRHGGHSKTKTPIQDYSDCSVQIPSPGVQTIQFFLERRYPSVPRNETHISLYFLDSQGFSEWQVFTLISRMEEQPGTKLVPFCVEHVGLLESPRHLNTAFMPDQVIIRFQLVNQVQRNFRLKDPRVAEKVITVPQIQSLSQGCVDSPRAEARVCMESVGRVGKLCEDHIRIILDYGDTTQNLLLSIWSCRQSLHSSLKNWRS